MVETAVNSLPATGVPIGTIIAFVLLPANIPDNWLLCDGSVIDTQYPLAAYIQKTPDLSGTALVGVGQAYPLGTSGGAESHTLSVAEMPPHTHGFSYQAPTGGATKLYSGDYWGPKTDTGTTDPTGGGAAFSIMQPYFAVNYIIYAGVPSN